MLRGFSVETLAYDQTMGDWRTHSGVDIAAEEGLKVLAPGKGEVTQVYDDPMMGSTVVISHPDGHSSLCANLADIQVAVGDQVDTGAVIGVVGGGAMAESAMPSHLHLEMTAEDGGPVDPLTVLPSLLQMKDLAKNFVRNFVSPRQVRSGCRQESARFFRGLGRGQDGEAKTFHISLAHCGICSRTRSAIPGMALLVCLFRRGRCPIGLSFTADETAWQKPGGPKETRKPQLLPSQGPVARKGRG